jgi:hypothetical protein
MNCGTFELPRIACAVAEVMKAHYTNECASCDTPFTVDQLLAGALGYYCPSCEAAVCILCGCTDEHACAEGCSWLEPGVCSTHQTELDAAFTRHGVRLSA